MSKLLFVSDLRPATREDMDNIGPARAHHTVSMERIRESHHRIARFAAEGLRTNEIARLTGYSPARISAIINSPAMKDLIARNRARIDEGWAEDVRADYSVAREAWRVAQRQLLDRLEDADAGGDPIPLRDLRAIAADGEDRFGVTKKSTNINLNADFAAELERALSRSASVNPKVIEVEPTSQGIRRRI